MSIDSVFTNYCPYGATSWIVSEPRTAQGDPRLGCRRLFQPYQPTQGMPMLDHFRMFLKDESGATAIEYGLIAAGISVAIIAVVNGVGTQLNVTFSKVKSALAAQ